MNETRIAIVTGGIGGIGQGVSRCLPDHRKVVATYLPFEEEKARNTKAAFANEGLELNSSGGHY